MEARVAPLFLPPPPPSGPPELAIPDEFTYEIVQSGALHTVDLSRSMKTELFSPRFVQRWNAGTRRLRYVIAGSHNLVHVLVVVALAAPRDIGCAVGLALVPLGVPGCFATLLALRYDLLYVLVRTYDFWFFWTVTLLSTISLALLLGDARACGSLFVAIGIFICLVVDASMSLSRVFTVSSATAVLLGLVVIAIVHLELVPDTHERRITYNARSIVLSDMVVNGIATLVILLARNAYRRKQAVHHGTATNQASIRCITYRCQVKLQRVTQRLTASAPTPSTLRLDRVSSVPRLLSSQHHTLPLLPPPRVSELQLVPIKETFDSRRCLLGREWTPSRPPWPRAVRVGLCAASATAMVSTGALFFLDIVLDHSSLRHHYMTLCASSIVLSSIIMTCLQPQLVRRLARSFDCVFVSLQLTVVHLCACDTFAWDTRALLVGSAHLWIHVVLAMDALMPPVRKQLGLRRIFPIVVVATYACGASMYLAKFLLDASWALSDRVLVEMNILGRRVELHVVPMIVSRLPIVITWALRLLWRIITCKEGELILIQGAVAYDRPDTTK